METTLTKLTVAEMEANPAKWERFELYKGEPLEMTYTKPNHARILMRIGAKKNKQHTWYRKNDKECIILFKKSWFYLMMIFV